MLTHILICTGIVLVAFILIRLEKVFRIFYKINLRHEMEERQNRNQVDDFKSICNFIDNCTSERSMEDVNKMIGDFDKAYQYRDKCGTMVGYMRQIQFARTKFIEAKRTQESLN